MEGGAFPFGGRMGKFYGIFRMHFLVIFNSCTRCVQGLLNRRNRVTVSFLGAGHLLQVRSHGRSISFTIHWFPTPKVSFRKCDTKKLASFLPLSESKFMWTYIGGTKVSETIAFFSCEWITQTMLKTTAY